MLSRNYNLNDFYKSVSNDKILLNSKCNLMNYSIYIDIT